MELYDAKKTQICNICGFKLSHNKQGRFTSHLKEHNLNLDNYLLHYYYSNTELECNRSTCDNTVKLTRGIPNKYCSQFCRQKKPSLVCVTCGSAFEAKNRKTKTCSKKCAKIIKSKKIKQWHRHMSKSEKEKHFKNIITKTAKTRRANNTPSWNSGKKGVYSESTIDKIRQATLKQVKNHCFRKTKIERLMENYFLNHGIKYRYSFILENRQFDFVLFDLNVIIECDGDYWHANPKFYPVPKDWQVDRMKIDLLKNEIANKNGYNIVRLWKDDILNNFEYVTSIIDDLLATT